MLLVSTNGIVMKWWKEEILSSHWSRRVRFLFEFNDFKTKALYNDELKYVNINKDEREIIYWWRSFLIRNSILILVIITCKRKELNFLNQIHLQCVYQVTLTLHLLILIESFSIHFLVPIHEANQLSRTMSRDTSFEESTSPKGKLASPVSINHHWYLTDSNTFQSNLAKVSN